MVHGDDFTAVGTDEALNEYEREIQKFPKLNCEAELVKRNVISKR